MIFFITLHKVKMAKTNKELRFDFAKEMRDKRKEKNEQLEQVENSKFSQWLKEQKSKEIKENFEKEIDEIKSRPWYSEARETHLQEIKAKIRLKKAKKELEDAENSYNEYKVAHRWKVEDLAENGGEIPPELKNFREKWKNEIRYISNESKEKIIKAAEKIQVKVKPLADGSRDIEIKLADETYKMVDVNLEKHSDVDYLSSYKSNLQTKKEVRLWWMRGDDTRKRKNKKLAKYVEQERQKGLKIPSGDSWEKLLKELWANAWLNDESDQVAMLMYLTWMYGFYCNTMGGKASRSGLRCVDYYRWFFFLSNDDYNASLCLIAW